MFEIAAVAAGERSGLWRHAVIYDATWFSSCS